MKEERLKVLEMLQQGKIDAQQAERLLLALEASYQAERSVFEAARVGAGNIKQSVKDFAQKVLSKLPRPSMDSAENYGKLTLTNEMLTNMADDCHYSNFGVLMIDAEVSVELLARKIAGYDNYGKTIGPAVLISLLQARGSNYGKFKATDATATGQEQEPADTEA